jgi:hypothetical protein
VYRNELLKKEDKIEDFLDEGKVLLLKAEA